MIDGQQHTFGVSGLLHRSNLLFYDVETGSLWSQLLSEAVTGPLAGRALRVLPAENAAWEAWKAAHPETRVMSFATGFERNYREDPYATYPLVRNLALLVVVEGWAKIYPFSELEKGPPSFADHVGGRQMTINYEAQTQTVHVENQPADGRAFVAFFEGLRMFYPHARVYRHARR